MNIHEAADKLLSWARHHPELAEIGDCVRRVSNELKYGIEKHEGEHRMKRLLEMSVNEIELSVRAANCLSQVGIATIGQLVQKTESDLRKTRNFGKKSLNEIKEKLSALDLRLGMLVEESEEVVSTRVELVVSKVVHYSLKQCPGKPLV